MLAREEEPSRACPAKAPVLPPGSALEAGSPAFGRMAVSNPGSGFSSPVRPACLSAADPEVAGSPGQLGPARKGSVSWLADAAADAEAGGMSGLNRGSMASIGSPERKVSRRGTLATIAFETAMSNQKYKMRTDAEMEAITKDSEQIEGFLRRRNSWKEGCSHSIAEFASKIREACSMRKAAQAFLRGVGRNTNFDDPSKTKELQDQTFTVLKATIGQSAILEWVAKKEDDEGTGRVVSTDLYDMHTTTSAVLPSVVRVSQGKRQERGHLIRRFKPGTEENDACKNPEPTAALKPRTALKTLVAALGTVGVLPSGDDRSRLSMCATTVIRQMPSLEVLMRKYGWDGMMFEPVLTREAAQELARELEIHGPGSPGYREHSPLDVTPSQSVSRYPQLLAPIQHRSPELAPQSTGSAGTVLDSTARAKWEKRRQLTGKGAMAHFPRQHERVTMIKAPVDYAALLQEQQEQSHDLEEHDSRYNDMMDRFDRINYLNQRRLSRLLKPNSWNSKAQQEIADEIEDEDLHPVAPREDMGSSAATIR